MFHVQVCLRKQPTFRDATSGVLAKIMTTEKRAQRFNIDGALLPRSDLGSASDGLRQKLLGFTC